MAKIKLGIIGTGGMANAHARAYSQIRGCEVVACMDVVHDRAQAFARAHGVRHVCDDVAGVIAESDAVSVVTTDRFHVPISLDVLTAGRHLFCEKPLATTLEEARRLMRVWQRARRRGVIGMINFSHRAGHHFLEAQRLVRAGRLGDVRYVRANYLQGWLSSEHWGHWETEHWLWRLQTAAGSAGALGDIGCHILDFVTGVVGPVKRLHCSMRTHRKVLADGRQVTRRGGQALDANDSLAMQLDFAGGAFGVCEASRWATGIPNSVNLEVYGTEGALACGHGNRSLDTYLHTTLGAARHKSRWQARKLKPRPEHWQGFIKAIKTGRPVQPDLARGAEIQAYLDACERSSASDGTVAIRNWM